jgi:hypothetical protein
MEAIVVTIMCISLTILCLIFTGQSDAKFDMESAVGIWLFDDGSGNVAKDTSGKGHDGKLMNGPKWVNGKFAMALEFDGKDDYVDCGDDDNLNVNRKPKASVNEVNTFTLMAWVFPTSIDAATHEMIAGKGWSATERSYYLSLYQGKAFVSFRNPGNTAQADVQGNTAFQKSTWYHIAGINNRKENKAAIYVNGVKENEKAIDYDVMVTPKPLWIGNMEDQTLHFNGIIDDFAIFNVALSEDEIKNIMTKGLRFITAVSPAGKLAAVWGGIKAQ